MHTMFKYPKKIKVTLKTVFTVKAFDFDLDILAMMET